jgi:hypothetical protein
VDRCRQQWLGTQNPLTSSSLRNPRGGEKHSTRAITDKLQAIDADELPVLLRGLISQTVVGSKTCFSHSSFPTSLFKVSTVSPPAASLFMVSSAIPRFVNGLTPCLEWKLHVFCSYLGWLPQVWLKYDVAHYSMLNHVST